MSMQTEDGRADRVRRRRADVADVITPRQRQVAAMMADGLTYQEMADTLGVEGSTVKYHITQLIRRMSPERGSRTQAVARAIRAGLIP